jgi:hypothetical protein
MFPVQLHFAGPDRSQCPCVDAKQRITHMMQVFGAKMESDAWLELVEDGTADTVEGGAIKVTRTSGSPTEVKQSRGYDR